MYNLYGLRAACCWWSVCSCRSKQEVRCHTCLNLGCLRYGYRCSTLAVAQHCFARERSTFGKYLCAFKIYSIWPQTNKHTHASCNAVPLVWGSLRLAPISLCSQWGWQVCLIFPPSSSWLLTVGKNRRKPEIFIMQMNDINVYQCRQRVPNRDNLFYFIHSLSKVWNPNIHKVQWRSCTWSGHTGETERIVFVTETASEAILECIIFHGRSVHQIS